MRLVAPSLLSANFNNLQKDIAIINDSQADWLHLDVMDGVLFPISHLVSLFWNRFHPFVENRLTYI